MSRLHHAISHIAAALTLVFLSASAHAGAVGGNATPPSQMAVQTEAGQRIPAGAYGIVEIKNPVEATLLQLRGLAGRGDVVLRGDESGMCISFPLRLVAGDFGGDAISGRRTSSVLLVLRSRRVTEALARGEDIVSDMYRVSKEEGADADIIIKTGLNADHGFVLNPGSNILADIFGVETHRIACAPA